MTSQAQLITAWWKEFISGPTHTEDRKLIQPGAHLEHLALEADGDHVWFTGIITLPQGQQVRVKAADIAAVYQIPVSQVELGDPKHYAPNALPVTVRLKVPAAQPQIAAGTPTTPEEMWAAYVGVPEGAMPGTTLTLTRYDGPLDWEGIATRDRRAIGTVNLQDLAGNLDLETIQIALAPGDKPSQMGIRVMREHALMHGTMLSSVVDELSMDSRGYVRAGTYVDGAPAASGAARLRRPPPLPRRRVQVGQVRTAGADPAVRPPLPYRGDPRLPTGRDHRRGPAVGVPRGRPGRGDGRAAPGLRDDARPRGPLPLPPRSPSPTRWSRSSSTRCMLLSASSPYHLEAKAIVEQLTRRTLKRGIGVVLATQTPLAEDLGNSTVIRSQLLIGGGAVFLRCAKGQGSLVGANAVEGAEGIDLSMIPSQWPGQYAKVADRDMSGLATEAAAAPEDGTFGLGYLLTPGSQAVQFRSLHLDVPPVSLAGGEPPVGIEVCDALRALRRDHPDADGRQARQEPDRQPRRPPCRGRGRPLVAGAGAPPQPRRPPGRRRVQQARRSWRSRGGARRTGADQATHPRAPSGAVHPDDPAETIARKLGTSAKNIKPRLSELKKRDEVTNENGLWRAE